MKKQLLFLILVLFAPVCLLAQMRDYQVVFDLTSKDTTVHKTVIRWLDGISKERPDARLEVVLYSGSLDMVVKDKSTVAADLARLQQNKNISLKVCAATMKRYNVDASQLLPGVDVVADGIYEIISRQKEGWGYIKAAQ